MPFIPYAQLRLMGLISAMSFISSAIILLLGYHPHLPMFFLALTCMLYGSSIFVIQLQLKNWDNFTKKFFYVRIIADNLLVLFGVIVCRKYLPINGVFLYLICSMIHLSVSLCIQSNKQIIRLLQALMICSLAILITDYSLDLWLFIPALITLFIFINVIYKSYSRFLQQQSDNSKQRNLEKLLLKHNFGNMATILFAYADIDLADPFSKAVKRSIDVIKNIIESISDNEKVLCKLQAAIYRVIGCCAINSTVDYKVNIGKDYMIKVWLCPFVQGVAIYINNACEANAKNISVSIIENRYLQIKDDGDGFNTSKIKLGFTTKKNGHGEGLIRAQTALTSIGVDTKIDSVIGMGTTVTLDIVNILEPDYIPMMDKKELALAV